VRDEIPIRQDSKCIDPRVATADADDAGEVRVTSDRRR
jgi:hypothetical protein